MFWRNKRTGSAILLRLGYPPERVLTVDQSLHQEHLGGFGSNVGNRVFADAVYLTLATDGSEPAVDGFKTERNRWEAGNSLRKHLAWINGEFSAYVFPFANCFREGWVPVLNRLAERLGKLRVGLIFCSGGLDMQLDQTFADLSSDLKTLSKKVMRHFFDRSAMVGVRGEITAEYLRFLGFPDDQIAVIGCPSAYFPRFRKPLREAAPTLTADSRIALNQNYLAPDLSPFNWRTLTEFPHSVYVGQIVSDLQLLTGELPPQQVSPQQQFLFDHRAELGGRLKFPLSSFAWFEYLSTQAFVFGTRLHGCIPAILAGTPTLFPVWDTRSQEVTDYHGYPTIPLRPGVDSPADWDIAELARRYDPSPYLRKFDAGFQAWLDFLRANDLPTIFDPVTTDAASSDAHISAAAASASVTSENPPPTSAFEILETAHSQYIERLEQVNFPQVVEIDNSSEVNII